MTTVMIVEDELDARELVSAGLDRLGYSTIAVSNGAEALERLDDDIDVLVTDLVMPRLDGVGLLKQVRERGLAPLSIVITSFVDKAHTLGALNAGASYLIEKPFTVADLHQVMLRLLSGRANGASASAVARARLEHLGLNEREKSLVLYVLKGLPNREIAAQLSVSEQVVKNHLFQLYRKLGISSRGELFHLVFPV